MSGLKLLFITVAFILASLTTLDARVRYEKFKIADDIEILQLSEKVYLHTSYQQTENWGMVGANGLIVVDNDQAVMLDSPWNDQQTEILVKWVADSLKARVTVFVPNHWHSDCMGGLEYLHRISVKSYAAYKTIEIANEKGLPIPQTGFRKIKRLKINDTSIECYYPGAAHAMDNVVVWIPSEKILFGGCMFKDLGSGSMGNVIDGDLNSWPKTIKKVKARYSGAKIAVTGHGDFGGTEIMDHTLKLLEKDR